MKNNFTFFVILISAISVTYLVGFSSRVSRIPNGSENTCANCHINPGGGGARNVFGQAAESLIASGGSESFWGPQIAGLDSDGDGFTNGEELQDPNGEWIPGTASPGDITLVTNPGDPNDFPVSVKQLAEIPNDYMLSNNYPNPFNPTTIINFSIPENSDVLLEVYNTLGERVRMLVNENYSSGSYSTIWNGRDDFGYEVNAGVYIYRMVTNNFVDTKRMIFLK